MIRSDSTTAASVIPADVLERLEASVKGSRDYSVMDAAIFAYYPRLTGAAIARALGEKHEKNVQKRIAQLKAEKKIN